MLAADGWVVTAELDPLSAFAAPGVAPGWVGLVAEFAAEADAGADGEAPEDEVPEGWPAEDGVAPLVFDAPGEAVAAAGFALGPVAADEVGAAEESAASPL